MVNGRLLAFAASTALVLAAALPAHAIVLAPGGVRRTRFAYGYRQSD